MRWPAAVVTTLCVLGMVCPQDLHKRTKLRVCGEKLIQSLMVVCDNKYNKRNFLNYDSEPEVEESPWRSRSRALALFSRVRRGVVDECCIKSCSYKELSSYCLKSD